MWVWYCDGCDELGEEVETREQAIRGGRKHRRSQTEPEECCVTVSPPSMYHEVAFAALLGAGPV